MTGNKIVASVIVAGALLGACSSDGKALSKEDFLEQANAICKAGTAELEAALEELIASFGAGQEPTPDQISQVVLDEIVPNIRVQIDEIRDLEPPDELSDGVEEFLDEAQAAIDDLEEKAKDDPTTAFDEDPFVEASAKADAIGLTECSDDSEE